MLHDPTEVVAQHVHSSLLMQHRRFAPRCSSRPATYFTPHTLSPANAPENEVDSSADKVQHSEGNGTDEVLPDGDSVFFNVLVGLDCVVISVDPGAVGSGDDLKGGG